MAVEWHAVSSSNVTSVGWDEEAGELLVEFKSGAVYAYSGQSEATLQDLLTTPSPGGYVARHLRNAGGRRIS